MQNSSAKYLNRSLVYSSETKTRLFVDVLFSIFIIVSIFPLFSGIATEATLLLTFMLAPFLISKSSAVDKGAKKCVLLSLAFLAIVIIYYLLGISYTFFSILGNYLDWVISIFVCLFVFKTSSKKEKKYFATLIFCAINLSMFLILLQSRAYKGEDLSDIANASYSTLLMLFSGCCIVYALNVKRKIFKLLLIFSFFLSLYINTFILQRGTNLLLTIFMLLFIFIFKAKSMFLRVFLFLVVVIFVYSLLNSNAIDNFLDYLSLRFDVQRTKERVDTILNYLKTGDYENSGVRSFSFRFDYFFNSLRSFGKSPLFGVGDHREGYEIAVNNRAAYEIIGNHSEIIDNFGRYGIVGGSLCFAVMFLHLSIIRKKSCNLKHNVRMQFLIIVFVFLLRNVLGVAIGSVFSILLFVFLPTEIELLSTTNQHHFFKETRL